MSGEITPPTLPDVSLDQSVPFALCLVTIGVCQYFTLRRSRFAIESLQRKTMNRPSP